MHGPVALEMEAEVCLYLTDGRAFDQPDTEL
jgi:hypothetical protein